MIPPSWTSHADWQRLVAGEVNPLLTQFSTDTAKLTYSGNALKYLRVNSTADATELADAVMSVSVTTANGVSGTVATATTTPAITLTLGAITPSSVAATGIITSSGGQIGYATGAGGTVTQNTDKTTGVTLNKLCGTITMNNAALAASTAVSFTLTNNTIAATDLLILNIVGGATAGAYVVTVAAAAGSATITLLNVTAGSLGEAVQIRFAVFKSSNT